MIKHAHNYLSNFTVFYMNSAHFEHKITVCIFDGILILIDVPSSRTCCTRKVVSTESERLLSQNETNIVPVLVLLGQITKKIEALW